MSVTFQDESVFFEDVMPEEGKEVKDVELKGFPHANFLPDDEVERVAAGVPDPVTCNFVLNAKYTLPVSMRDLAWAFNCYHNEVVFSRRVILPLYNPRVTLTIHDTSINIAGGSTLEDSTCALNKFVVAVNKRFGVSSDYYNARVVNTQSVMYMGFPIDMRKLHDHLPSSFYERNVIRSLHVKYTDQEVISQAGNASRDKGLMSPPARVVTFKVWPEGKIIILGVRDKAQLVRVAGVAKRFFAHFVRIRCQTCNKEFPTLRERDAHETRSHTPSGTRHV